MSLLYDAARAVRHAVGAPWFTGPYDLNVFGIRRPWGPTGEITDLFDDAIVLAYRDDNLDPRVEVYPATTDPGKPWEARPMRPDGCAILVPGHYLSSHVLGTHKGYQALQQDAALKVWRDADHDGRYDTGAVHEAYATSGINIHSAADDLVSTTSEIVGRWSAGCQVLKRRSDLRKLVAAVEAQKRRGLGGHISYTLVDIVPLTGEARTAAYMLLGSAR